MLKYAFGVTFGKFSRGFFVRHKGIEINKSKIKAIQEMRKPKNLKEFHDLPGRLAYIQRLISNLIGHCCPFSHLINKGASFEWDEPCHKAFEKIKKYLSNPLMLGALIPSKPLILYIVTQ